MTPTNPEIVDACTRIVALVGTRITETEGEWWITLDEVEAACAGDPRNPNAAPAIDLADFYRAAHTAGVAGMKRFDTGSVGELITLLETLGCRDADGHLRDAGAYLNHDDHLELTDLLTRAYAHAVVVHTADVETFKQMLFALCTYAAARDTYESTYFPPEELIGTALDRWGRGSERRHLAERYLTTLIRRELVCLETVAPALVELLRTVARHEGYLRAIPNDEHARFDRRTDEFGLSGDGAQSRALRVLGLSENASPKKLKQRYRELMRRYHPDINPDGLEESKRITWAYAVLSD